MSLYKYSFWEVFKNAFTKPVWETLWPAIGDTLYMVAISTLFTLIIGVLLGLILVLTSPEGLNPIGWLNKGLGIVINCLRSLPQMIVIILMLPIARILVGKAYGSNACIIALVASCVPMFARLVESSLLEVTKGKIEAAKAMGAGNLRILLSVMLPEAFPSLIRAFTVAVIAVISMTALAGNFGAGGIGDIAVRFGFNRFQHDVLLATVLVLILIVQVVQGVGDFVSKLFLKKWYLIGEVQRKNKSGLKKWLTSVLKVNTDISE
ncbi:methionine ABC transporter permease [Sporanaerobium hydrogeniformans]|uniref:Methionine ABC transporter permease n=1 Tax=Sporanaerobium hydrogeniformans TaxID=3072179 RepID=A0AC61DCB4_9FIRM|nr:methionine ABC transporter permease [Sporanaerobium hydrogeniformans]PHV70535.1 methionine ABC transporter permease [Sporanaerobium hydrogeniformans]